MSKRIGIICILMVLGCLLVTGYGWISGRWSYPVGAPERGGYNNRPVGSIAVSVSQHGTLPAELVELQLVVETRHPDSLLQAEQLNYDISKRLSGNLSAELDMSAGDYLKTIDFRADTRYVTKNQQREFAGYQVVHTLKLRTEQLTKLSSLIKLALASGATRIDQITFGLKNQSDACKALMEPAVRLAEQRGTQLASLTGSHLLGIKQLTSRCVASDYMPMHNYYRGIEHSSSVASLVSEREATGSTNEVEVELQISTQWFVE